MSKFDELVKSMESRIDSIRENSDEMQRIIQEQEAIIMEQETIIQSLKTKNEAWQMYADMIPKSNVEKRARVMKYLEHPEWRFMTDSEIAKNCHVSQSFVNRLRREKANLEIGEAIAKAKAVSQVEQK